MNQLRRLSRAAVVALASLAAGCGAVKQRPHRASEDANSHIQVAWSARQVSPENRVLEATITNVTDSYLSVRIDRYFILRFEAVDGEPPGSCTPDEDDRFIVSGNTDLDPMQPCNDTFLVLAPKSKVTLGDVMPLGADGRNTLARTECVFAYELEYVINVMDETCEHSVQVFREIVRISDTR